MFKPVLQHKSTAADPFTFESKEEQRLRRRAELLQRVEEEERKVFATVVSVDIPI